MVEVLAAGLAGDNWALDAPSFTKGRSLAWRRLAIAATLLALNFPKRLALQLDRLAKLGVIFLAARRRRGDPIARRARGRDRKRRLRNITQRSRDNWSRLGSSFASC